MRAIRPAGAAAMAVLGEFTDMAKQRLPAPANFPQLYRCTARETISLSLWQIVVSQLSHVPRSRIRTSFLSHCQPYNLRICSNQTVTLMLHNPRTRIFARVSTAHKAEVCPNSHLHRSGKVSCRACWVESTVCYGFPREGGSVTWVFRS